ncbi:MAG: hypothetical protein FJ385_03825 [Verrucomicrobia bacterium]|nr:hypothetical protein [Verrucomicrobiota bacterium]
MNKITKFAFVLIAVTAGNCGRSAAEVAYEAHVGYASMYLWRGLDLGDDLVETGLDVSGSWRGCDLNAGAWFGSFDNAPAGNDMELDLYGGISRDFGPFTASIGYIFYHFGNVSPTIDAQEVCFTASRDFGFLEASVNWYWDIETDNDGYSDLALSKGFECSDSLTFHVESRYAWLVEQGIDAAWMSRASLDWEFCEKMVLSPFVTVSLALSDDAGYTASGNEWVSGLLLSFGD